MAKDYSGREALDQLMKLVKTDLHTKIDKDSIVDNLEGSGDDPNAVLSADQGKALDEKIDSTKQELQQALDQQTSDLDKKLEDLNEDLDSRLEDLKAETQDSVGEAGGLAPLDESGKIDTKYLPSYVDDVIEMRWVAAPEGANDTDYNRKFGGNSDELGNWLGIPPEDDESYNATLGDAIAVQSVDGVDPGDYEAGETITGMKVSQAPTEDGNPDMTGDDLSDMMDDIKKMSLTFNGPISVGDDDAEYDEITTIIECSLADLEEDGEDPSALLEEIKTTIQDAFDESNEDMPEEDEDAYWHFSNPVVTFTKNGITVTYDVTVYRKCEDGRKASATITFTGLYGNDVMGDTISIDDVTFKFVPSKGDAGEEEEPPAQADEIEVEVTYNYNAEKLATALKDAIEGLAEGDHSELLSKYQVTASDGVVTISAVSEGQGTITVDGNNVAQVEVVTFVRGKIYVDVDSNLSYRWSGSTLVLITSADMVEITADEIQSMWDALSDYTGEADEEEDDDEDHDGDN